MFCNTQGAQDHLDFMACKAPGTNESHTTITGECTPTQVASHPQTVNSLQDYVPFSREGHRLCTWPRKLHMDCVPQHPVPTSSTPGHAVGQDRTAAVWWCVVSQAALLVEQEDGRTWRRNTESPNHSRSPCAQGADPILLAVAPGPLTNTLVFIGIQEK